MPMDERANILIVDDLPEKLLAFSTVLEELGENVVTVGSGRDALREVLERDFAVILLDVNMPDMDGFETASLLRAYRRTEKTPIVFITAYADDVEAIRGYALGAVDYISSPFVPEILRSKVKVFVDLHRMNRKLIQYAAEREAVALANAQRAAAEHASRRANLLSQASRALTRSLDTVSIIEQLLHVCVPDVADAAIVTVIEPNASVSPDITGGAATPQPNSAEARAVAVPTHASRVARLQQWPGHTGAAAGESDRANQRAPVEATAPERIIAQEKLHRATEHVLRTLEPAWLDEWDEPLPAADASNAAMPSPDGMNRAAVASRCVLPLFTGARPFGSLLLCFDAHRDISDGAWIGAEITSRASIAFENAALFDALRNTDRRKSEFLAMLAHELRNPLAPIRNAVHLLRTSGVQDPTVRWARDLIDVQVQHMVRLVEDLLDISRIEHGRVTLRRERLALDTVIGRAVDASRPHLDERKHHFRLVAGATQAVLDGDIVRLAQVVSNLLNNAAKFTPPGGNVTLSTSFDDGMLSLSVQDDGDGIDAAFLPHVFDLFAQADAQPGRVQGGLGIGLTLVRHLVQLHGGSVECFSEGPGKGARFVVQLPAQIATPTDESDDNVVSLRNSGRVLVVDDLTASADSLAAVLELHGHSVQTASDGETAMRQMDTFMPDVVLLDIGLPDVSGVDVARWIRAQPRFEDVTIIALTGYGRDEDRARTRKAGVDHHLVKPADINTMLELIASRRPASGARKPASGAQGSSA
jgi:signal transduction histidine kinase/DNA-binding response OmpR family regulator